MRKIQDQQVGLNFFFPFFFPTYKYIAFKNIYCSITEEDNAEEADHLDIDELVKARSYFDELKDFFANLDYSG